MKSQRGGGGRVKHQSPANENREHTRALAQVEQLLQIAMAHHRGGQVSEAESVYRKVLLLSPNHPDALHLLGVLLHNAGDKARALELIARSIAANPQNALAHNSRGAVYASQGEFDKALESYTQAIQLNRNYVDAYANRAAAARALNQHCAALQDCDSALRLNPNAAAVWYCRGSLLGSLGDHGAALESFDRVILLQPQNADASHDRGVALTKLTRYREAVESFDKAIALGPDIDYVYCNRGAALYGLGEYEAALKSYDRAIDLRPQYPEALHYRGCLLMELKRYEDALSSFDRAFAFNPELKYLQGERLQTKRLVCEWTDDSTQCRQIEKQVESGRRVVMPFSMLGICSSAAVEKKAAEIYVRDSFPSSSVAAARPRRAGRDRICIGYFSGDFREHAVSFLMAEIFERHNRDRFEIVGFSFGKNTNDPMQIRISKAMDRFVNVQSMSDPDLVHLSRELEVDVAIDLMGHTTHSRTQVFADRVAPVQVNYLGLPGTMGAGFIDYLIADETLIPESSRKDYAEKIVYLPDCFQANDLRPLCSPAPSSRARHGLPENGFVFCCFNNHHKINPETFDIWMRILGRVEGSILWLLEGCAPASSNLRKEAAKRGIAQERLVFAGNLPFAEHLARQRCADLFLDTLPFNAGATASAALRAGLPLVTCMGEKFAGRMAASLLRAIGMPDLITTSPAAYENLAVEIALTAGRVQGLKIRLEQNLHSAPLFDATRFTRHLEAAYTIMYERSLEGLPPEHILVPRF